MSQLCVINGSIVDGGLNPISSAVIYASPVADSNVLYNTSTGYYQGLTMFPLSTTSNIDGSFSLSLLKNALFRIVIRYIGFDEIVLIPSTDSALLWTLVGSNQTTLNTSTGNVIISNTEAGW